MSNLTEPAQRILADLAAAGEVLPDHFKGQGYVVAGLVKRGLAEWVRAGAPRKLNATSLRITAAGREKGIKGV
jgi:hypothetical protein